MKNPPGLLIVPLLALLLTGCFTDSATRLAFDIECATARMAGHERFRIEHRPAKSRECQGRYTVQLDKVGALIVWCFGSAGKSSPAAALPATRASSMRRKPGSWTNRPARP